MLRQRRATFFVHAILCLLGGEAKVADDVDILHRSRVWRAGRLLVARKGLPNAEEDSLAVLADELGDTALVKDL